MSKTTKKEGHKEEVSKTTNRIICSVGRQERTTLKVSH